MHFNIYSDMNIIKKIVYLYFSMGSKLNYFENSLKIYITFNNSFISNYIIKHYKIFLYKFQHF